MSHYRAVYDGPLEEFVSRRDALVKALRTAGDREAANTVKGFRKPSRLAWALNLAALDNDDGIAPLVDAVTTAIDAQAAGSDVRAAVAELRVAVRDFSNQAARAAENAGHRLESAALATAVLAVIANPESFEQLRGGYLADIPEAGGLDFFAAIPTSQPTDTASSHRTQAAEQALKHAETRLRAAEERLQRAEEEVRDARDALDRARREAVEAAAQLREAQG